VARPSRAGACQRSSDDPGRQPGRTTTPPHNPLATSRHTSSHRASSHAFPAATRRASIARRASVWFSPHHIFALAGASESHAPSITIPRGSVRCSFRCHAAHRHDCENGVHQVPQPACKPAAPDTQRMNNESRTARQSNREASNPMRFRRRKCP
jgi:hypothetical protein